MADQVARYVEALAAEVRRNLQALPDGTGALAEAATAALDKMPPGHEVGALPVLAHAASGAELPPQGSLSDTFGQPPLVVHREDDFFIQALTWVEGSTSIHQHGFEGAFAVADGLSLHVPYGFALGETVADGHMVTGDLQMQKPEILRPGSVRPIEAGFGFIHALFHLERPTLTFVIRNSSSDLSYPQYTYLRPGLGWDELNVGRQDGKRRQAATALARLDAAAGQQAVAAAVADGPAWLAFLFLRDWVERSGWSEQTAELSHQLERRVPPLSGVLSAALAGAAHQQRVLMRRGLLRQQHQRLFLALLANLPDRLSVEAVLEALHPGRLPQEVLWEAIADLASPEVRSVSGLRLTAEQLDALRTWLLAVDGPTAPPDLSTLGDGWQQLPAFLEGVLGSGPEERVDRGLATAGAEGT